MMEEEIRLNEELLKACTAETIDFELIESLLKQGAKPLGAVSDVGRPNNLYDEIVDEVSENGYDGEDFYKVTELFLRYGMDISKPSVPYDGSWVLNPLWSFAFLSGEYVLRTLKALLDHGLSAEDAKECWEHEDYDLVCMYGELSCDEEYEKYYCFIRKLMLFASYPHVLNADKDLQDEIWFSFNDYDVSRFRNWNDFSIDVDTSRCGKWPHVRESVVTIIEKRTSKAIWKFGVDLMPEEI